MPKTKDAVVLALTAPDLDSTETTLFYVSANDNAGTNIDLLVRAHSVEQATTLWYDHFVVGWDLPEKPASVMPVPVKGKVGVIEWTEILGCD